MILLCLAYLYVGATCGALAWGMTDDFDPKDTRGIVLTAAVLWPLVLPAIVLARKPTGRPR